MSEPSSTGVPVASSTGAPDPTREGLVARGVTHRYGRVLAVDGVDLAVRPGRVTCLVGPNGAGKSTLLHALVGLLRPDAGEVRVFGARAGSLRAARLLGFVYDDLPLPAQLTGGEALGLLAGTHQQWDADHAGDLVDLFGLRPALGRLISGYSHGMKRKLQLVASLGHRPAVWLLDEPFRSLDPLTVDTLDALVQGFVVEGGAVLVATHDLAGVERRADDVVVLADGRVVAAGPLDEVVGAAPSLASAYLELTGLRGPADAARSQLARLNLSPTDPRSD